MSNLAPQGWSLHDLGDLTEKIEGGGTPSRSDPAYWSGNIPWVTVKDLKKVRLSFAEESISEIGLKESASRLIPKNTLIISTRMALGKAVIFDRDVTINQDLKAVFPKRCLNSEYLLQWYLSKSDYIQSLGTGSTVKGIRLDDLRLIPISLPPLPEQQKIAAILTAVDNVIESTQAQINKLKDLKTGMMQELLTKGIDHTEFKDSPVGRIPAKWQVVELEKLCKWMGVGIATSTTHAYADNGIPLLRNQNILAGSIDKTDVLRITKEFSEENNSKKIKARDVITIRTGYPGKSAVVTEEFHDCHTFTTLISRPDASLIDSDFLALIINSDYGMNFVAGGQAGGAQQNLNVSILKIFPVKLPDLIEQRKIFGLVSSVTQKIDLVEKKQDQFIKTKKALMQDLLTGKVRVKVN